MSQVSETELEKIARRNLPGFDLSYESVRISRSWPDRNKDDGIVLKLKNVSILNIEKLAIQLRKCYAEVLYQDKPNNHTDLNSAFEYVKRGTWVKVDFAERELLVYFPGD